MATIGLRDLYRAPITVGEDGAETYGTPVRMAKAISVEMSVEVAEATLYADDGVDETIKEFVSGEISINANDLPSTEEKTATARQDDQLHRQRRYRCYRRGLLRLQARGRPVRLGGQHPSTPARHEDPSGQQRRPWQGRYAVQQGGRRGTL